MDGGVPPAPKGWNTRQRPRTVPDSYPTGQKLRWGNSSGIPKNPRSLPPHYARPPFRGGLSSRHPERGARNTGGAQQRGRPPDSHDEYASQVMTGVPSMMPAILRKMFRPRRFMVPMMLMIWQYILRPSAVRNPPAIFWRFLQILRSFSDMLLL